MNAINFQTVNSPAFDQLFVFQNSILKNVILPNPYQSSTNDFINIFSVKVIKNILNSAVTDQNLVNAFSEILENYIQILIIMFDSQNLDFLEAATQITNPNNIFYATISKKNKTPKQYKEIINLLKKKNFYEQITNFFEKIDSIPLKHISILINLLIAIKEKKDNYIDCISFVIQRVILIFETYKDLREIDDKLLNSTLDSIYSLESSYLQTCCSLNFQLQINLKFAKSDLLEKRFNGVNNIVSMIKNVSSTIQKQICKYVNDYKILDEILKDFHHQLVNPFISILTQLIQNQFNVQSYIISFWEVSIKQSSSIAPEFFSGWKNLISNQQIKNNIFDNYSDALFYKISESLNFPDASFPFLNEICVYANEDQKESVFNAFLNFCSIQKTDISSLTKTITSYMPKNSENIKKRIMKESLEMISNNYNLQLARALFLNLKLNSNQSNEYLSSLFNVLNSDNSMEVIDILFVLLKQFNGLLNENQFSKILEIYLPKLETNSKKVVKFFEDTLIIASNSNKLIYTMEMKKQLYKSICSLQSFDSSFVSLIVMLFNSINLESKEKVGIELLWEIAFRTKNQEILIILRSQMTTAQYVETCMKNISNPGSLECLYDIILKKESYMNNQVKWILKMPLINKYIDKDYLIPVQITGSTTMIFYLTTKTKFEALKTFISLYLKVDLNSIVLSIKGMVVTDFEKEITTPTTVEVTIRGKSNINNNYYYNTELPTSILFSNENYRSTLTDLLEDQKLGETVLKILNKMPTLPKFAITFDLDEENEEDKEINNFTLYQWDWNQFLSFEKPNHLIYHLNTIANDLNVNNIEWVRWIFNTGGAFKLMDLMLKTKDSPFDLLCESNNRKFNDKEYLILLFIIRNMLSLNLDDEMNEIISQIEDKVFNEFLHYASKLISNDKYTIVSYILLSIIEKITLIRGIKDTEETIDAFIELFEISCFHKKEKIRICATGFLHKKEIQSHNIMIKLLPKAIIKNNSDFIISIVSLVNDSNDKNDRDLIWNTFIDSTFEYFGPLKNKNVDGIWRNLNTPYPQEDFLQTLFSSFISLIHSFEVNKEKENLLNLQIPRIEDLYFFLFDVIINNQLIYFKITNQLINLLNLIISVKPSLVKETIPRIMELQKEISSMKKSLNQGKNVTLIENNLNRGPCDHIKGLRNLGATCYMASLLQQLYSIPIFRSNLLNLELSINDENKSQVESNKVVSDNDNDSTNEAKIENLSNENSQNEGLTNETKIENLSNENEIGDHSNVSNQNDNVNASSDAALSNENRGSVDYNQSVNESNQAENPNNESIQNDNANVSSDAAFNNENNSSVENNQPTKEAEQPMNPSKEINQNDNANVISNAATSNENSGSVDNNNQSANETKDSNLNSSNENSIIKKPPSKESQNDQSISNQTSNNNTTKSVEKKDDYKWLLELQYLFLKMLIYPTLSSSIDPTNFVREWKGWDGNPINAHQQQDAEEYLSLILSRLEPKLPIVDSLFKGKIENHLQGEGKYSKYERDSVEDYFDISLEVKGHKGIESSFNAYKTPDVFEGNNQYFTDEMGPIDATRTHLILEQSPILIITLKRFQFNMQTLVKEKISTKYEFPLKLDISPILVNKKKSNDESSNANRNETSNNNNNENNNYNNNKDNNNENSNDNSNDNNMVSSLYELYGVILHKGVGDAGHYISHIKGPDQNWRIYNDSIVQVESVKEMLNACYGGEETSQIYDDFGNAIRIDNGNAYILFYRRVDFDFDCQSGLGEGKLPVSPNLITRLAEDVKKDILTEISCSEEYFNFITSINQDPEFLLSLLSSKSGISQKCINNIMRLCINKCKTTTITKDNNNSNSNNVENDSKSFVDYVLSFYKEKSACFLINKEGNSYEDIISSSFIMTVVKEALSSPLVSPIESQDFINDIVMKINEIESIEGSNNSKELINSINRKLNIYTTNIYSLYEIAKNKNKQIDTSKSVSALTDYLSKNKGRNIGSIINLIIKMDQNNKQGINNIAKFFTDEMLLNYFIIDESKEFLSLMVKRIKEDPSKLDLILSLNPENINRPSILGKIFICILSSKKFNPQNLNSSKGNENKNYMEIFFSDILRGYKKTVICSLLEYVIANISSFIEDVFDHFIHYSDFLVDKLIFSNSIEVRKSGCSLFLKFIFINESIPNLSVTQKESKKKSLFVVYQSLITRLKNLQNKVTSMAYNDEYPYSSLVSELPVEHYFYLLTHIVKECRFSSNIILESENLATFLINTSYSFSRFNEPCFVRKYVLNFIIETIPQDNRIQFFGVDGEVLQLFKKALPFYNQHSSRDMKELEAYSDTYIRFILMIPFHLFSSMINTNFVFQILLSKKIVKSALMTDLYKYLCKFLDLFASQQDNQCITNFANQFFMYCLHTHLDSGQIIPIKIAMQIMKKYPKLSNIFYNNKIHKTVWSLIYKRIYDYENQLSKVGIPIDATVFLLMNLLGVFIKQFSIVPENKSGLFGSDYKSISSYYDNDILLKPTAILKFSISGNIESQNKKVFNSKGSFVFLRSFYCLNTPNKMEDIFKSLQNILELGDDFISHVPFKAKLVATDFLLTVLKWGLNNKSLLYIGKFKNEIDAELANYINYIFQRDSFQKSTSSSNEAIRKKEKKIDRDILALLSKESFNNFKYTNEQSINKLFEAFKCLMLYADGTYYFNSADLVNLNIKILIIKKMSPLDWIHNIQVYILNLIKCDYNDANVSDFISAAHIINEIMKNFQIKDMPKIEMNEESRKNQENWAASAQGGTSPEDDFVVMNVFLILVPK